LSNIQRSNPQNFNEQSSAQAKAPDEKQLTIGAWQLAFVSQLHLSNLDHQKTSGKYDESTQARAPAIHNVSKNKF